MKYIIIAALVVGGIIGKAQSSTQNHDNVKCNVCNGSGFKGNFKCSVCGGDGDF